jgi:hypothetical protein
LRARRQQRALCAPGDSNARFARQEKQEGGCANVTSDIH